MAVAPAVPLAVVTPRPTPSGHRLVGHTQSLVHGRCPRLGGCLSPHGVHGVHVCGVARRARALVAPWRAPPLAAARAADSVAWCQSMYVVAHSAACRARCYPLRDVVLTVAVAGCIVSSILCAGRATEQDAPFVLRVARAGEQLPPTDR